MKLPHGVTAEQVELLRLGVSAADAGVLPLPLPPRRGCRHQQDPLTLACKLCGKSFEAQLAEA